MSHSGKLLLLSLGKFKMFPSLSQWGHPSHMTWDTVNTLQGSCHEPGIFCFPLLLYLLLTKAQRLVKITHEDTKHDDSWD